MITILKGDCLEVMKSMKDKSIDCFICDLPYGQLSTPKIGGQANVRLPNERCAWDVKIDLTSFWVQVERLARNDAVPIIHFCNTKFGIDLINSKPDWFRYDLVWDKGRGVSFLLANKMPMKSHEMIYIFSKKGAYYKRIDGVRCPLSVIPITGKNSHSTHPTQKPEEIYEWLLSRYCPEGGTVLDPTAGSFNSIAVADRLGLKGIGIEKDIPFFNKAIQRFFGV